MSDMSVRENQRHGQSTYEKDIVWTEEVERSVKEQHQELRGLGRNLKKLDEYLHGKAAEKKSPTQGQEPTALPDDSWIPKASGEAILKC